MNTKCLPSGDLEIDLDLEELSWFGQTLNECCGGFGVKDFVATMGASESVVRQLLDQIVAAYPATLGSGVDDENR